MSGYEELMDIESIKQLKARYFRFVDTHRWEEFLDLFSTDAIFDLGDGLRFEDAAAFVAFVRENLDAVRSVHQGFMPEIQLTGTATAEGIWAMSDYLEADRSDRPVMRGYGHYHETYRKEEGRWRISSMRLTRLRVDTYGPSAEQ